MISWIPPKIDNAYDEMRERLGREPRAKEFEKECKGAMSAIRKGRYDENIRSWPEYVLHRARPEIKELFLEFIGGL